ncbi:hypothetical protein NHH73_19020 [Oxalobacteraceae bacterium OTU3CINTB1]|nr:hypothetical protein NHH73_19020 [Oxalobacteraceae bacterium OTU3CINTB1]
MNFPGFTAERSLKVSDMLFNVFGVNSAPGRSDQVEAAGVCKSLCMIGCLYTGSGQEVCDAACNDFCTRRKLVVQPQFTDIA